MMDTNSSQSCPPAESPGAPRPEEENGNGHSPADAFAQVGQRFGELKEYVSYYIAARSDAMKLTLKNAAMYAVLGVLGLMAGAAIIIAAAVLTCYGIAHGLAVLFGGRLWLGELVTGVVILGAIFGGALLAIGSMISKSRKQTVERYENRQREQLQRFGHNVRQRGQEHAQHAEKAGADR